MTASVPFATTPPTTFAVKGRRRGSYVYRVRAVYEDRTVGGASNVGKVQVP